MSSFYCCNCGAAIIDSDTGYTTGCKHYPLERKKVNVERKNNAVVSYVASGNQTRIDLVMK